MTVNCQSIKQLLTEHLVAHIDVQQIRDLCVATVPFPTLDNRWVDVFIEPRNANFFLIHDGGKAVNELILQGMRVTPSVSQHFASIAAMFGVAYTDEMFQTGAKVDGIAKQVLAIGMCSALAMTQLLEHSPADEEYSLAGDIGSYLRRWGRNRAKVQQNVTVPGDLKQHTFDYVVTPKKGPAISLSILNPTAGALSAAERFGFKAKDLQGTDYGKWKRVAIETKSEVWSQQARRIVDRCADYVIEIPSEDHAEYEQISKALDSVA